jgi:hypothetical protein
MKRGDNSPLLLGWSLLVRVLNASLEEKFIVG